MLDNNSENIDPIEDFFRKSFQEHEETPSPHVWNAISTKLKPKVDSDLEIPFWKKTSFQITVGITILLLIVSYFYFPNRKEEKALPVIPKITREEKQHSIPNPDKTKQELPVVASSKNTHYKERKLIQNEATTQQEQVVETEELTVPVELEEKTETIVSPTKEEKEGEPEPANLYEQMKKEQIGKEKRELFIEKQE